jgi:hypothetical protein
MSTGKLIYIGLIIFVIIIFAYVYMVYRDNAFVENLYDGESVYLSGTNITVNKASYYLGCKKHNVKLELQEYLGINFRGGIFTFHAEQLGLSPGGTLSFSYKCAANDASLAAANSENKQAALSFAKNVAPGLMGANPSSKSSSKSSGKSTMGNPSDFMNTMRDPPYSPSQDRSDTVYYPPYSPETRVSLERSAMSPGNAEMSNPITGVGNGTLFRELDDPYRDNSWKNDGMSALGSPDYLENMDTNFMNLMTTVANRATAAVTVAPGCLQAGPDFDSDFVSDGMGGVTETGLTSQYSNPSQLAGIRVGLGSKRIDPRFQPGMRINPMLRDTNQAPGRHAGDQTLGALTSSVFQTGGSWHSTPWGFARASNGDIQALTTGCLG